MISSKWRDEFDREMQREYCITLLDAGLDHGDIQRWHEAFPSDAKGAVRAYGEAYDL
jgi:hypothetical protein